MGPCLSKQPVNHGEAYELSGASEPKDKKDKKDKPEVRANPDSHRVQWARQPVERDQD